MGASPWNVGSNHGGLRIPKYQSRDQTSVHKNIFLCFWKLPPYSPAQGSVGPFTKQPKAPLLSEGLEQLLVGVLAANFLLQAVVLMRFQQQCKLVANYPSWSYSLQDCPTWYQFKVNHHLSRSSHAVSWQQWNPWAWYFEAEFPLISGKWKAECGWWSSDIPFHYFSNNRPLLSLYQIPFQEEATQEIVFQHKHFFVLNILKSLLIRDAVSHPAPGSPIRSSWVKKPSESLHLSMRTDYFTKQSPVSWKSLFSEYSEDCSPWLTQDYLEISITPASFSEWLTSLQLALACQLFQRVAVTMLMSAGGKKEHFRAWIKTLGCREQDWGFLKRNQFPCTATI